MSFLAPLFLIGAAGVAIPLILHLIRRQAKGQQDFSSLLFLDPSPPTLLQRSRVDQWLLLLLRALAICLLAAAFSRPYWNTLAISETPSQVIHKTILVDTSASMQREGLWKAAVAAMESIVKSAQPLDTIALYSFDDHVQTSISVEDSMATAPETRSQQVLAAVHALKPTWRGTNLGLALATMGDRLVRTDESEKDTHVSASEIVLVTDFQSGSLIDKLENYQWPSECKLTIKRVAPSHSENVSLSILVSKEETLTAVAVASSTLQKATEATKALQDGIAVRLSNYNDHSEASISLQWFDEYDKPIDESRIEVDVPIDGNRVVQIPKLSSEAGRLKLNGDMTTFDNDRYVAKVPKRNFSVVCLDQERREASESLGYFLQKLPLDDDTRNVQFQWRSPGSTDPWPEKNFTPLIVASHDMLDSDVVGLRKFIESGGHGLWVLDHSLENAVVRSSVESHWQALTGDLPPNIHEGKSRRDTMFEEIDFKHLLFRGMADSKFNDFTKIRFWKHRCVEIGEAPPWTIVARFDDAFPAIAHRSVGEGMLWLMTSGWQPSESQLALSSKFVPIVSGIFARAAPLERSLEALVVGDKVEYLDGESWFDPTGARLVFEVESDGKKSVVVDQLGFYRLTRDGQSRWVAVNLPLAESDTRVMDDERLEQLGVVASEAKPTKFAMQRREQLRGVELEGQQRVWRWLMVGMLAVIVIETAWSAKR